MTILNLTQHPASAEQLEAGVVDLPPQALKRLRRLLSFASPPNEDDVTLRASEIATLAGPHAPTLGASAMIGGAPYLMGPLERALEDVGIAALYGFTLRESVEEVQADGSTKKVAIYRHLGFVPACTPGSRP